MLCNLRIGNLGVESTSSESQINGFEDAPHRSTNGQRGLVHGGGNSGEYDVAYTASKGQLRDPEVQAPYMVLRPHKFM